MNTKIPISEFRARHQELIDYRSNNPCLTLEQIGRKFGITREAVRQILARAGERTSSLNYGNWVCSRCGKRISITDLPKRKYCPECRKILKEQLTTMLTCDYCGKLFPRRTKDVLLRIGKRGAKHVFCSKVCQGRYLGDNFGFIHWTIEQHRAVWDNMSPKKKEEIYRKRGKAVSDWLTSLTPKQKKERAKNISEGLKHMQLAQKEEWTRNVSKGQKRYWSNMTPEERRAEVIRRGMK